MNNLKIIIFKKYIFTLIFVFIAFNPLYAWLELDTGLQYEVYDVPKEYASDAKIHFLKIDPEYYDFKLLTMHEYGEKKLTAKQWCKKYNITGAINAGMFNKNNRSCGFMRNYKIINNSRINPKFGAFLVFNPATDSAPAIQIIDKYNQDWKKLKKEYHTIIQSYRMISTNQNNVWQQSYKKNSTTSIAMDKKGKVLYIFSRYPFTTHDFNNILLKLPVNIYNAMYLEGGPEATLYFKVKNTEKELFGSYETEFVENDDNSIAWEIPNIIGFIKKDLKK